MIFLISSLGISITNESILKKHIYTPTNPHPPPDLPLEGGGTYRFPSPSGGGEGGGGVKQMSGQSWTDE